MTHREFTDFQAYLITEVYKMTDTKGKEYANSVDKFANFRRLAVQLGLTDIQVGWVYLAKHLDGIASYCRTGQTHSTETIRGRIVDSITYLTLLAGMIYEKESVHLTNVKVYDSSSLSGVNVVPTNDKEKV